MLTFDLMKSNSILMKINSTTDLKCDYNICKSKYVFSNPFKWIIIVNIIWIVLLCIYIYFFFFISSFTPQFQLHVSLSFPLSLSLFEIWSAHYCFLNVIATRKQSVNASLFNECELGKVQGGLLYLAPSAKEKLHLNKFFAF